MIQKLLLNAGIQEIQQEEDVRLVTALNLASYKDLYDLLKQEADAEFGKEMVDPFSLTPPSTRALSIRPGKRDGVWISLKTGIYRIHTSDAAIGVTYRVDMTKEEHFIFEMLLQKGRWTKHPMHSGGTLHRSISFLRASLEENRVESVIRKALNPSFVNYINDLEAE